MEIVVRHPRVADEGPCAALLAGALGTERAREFVASRFRGHRVVVAEAGGAVVGFLAWRTDWFDCSFVERVFVREDFRRRGIAREMYRAVDHQSRGPRVFSSAEEDNAAAIRMHGALGFEASGHVDNLPQGTRELIFFRRIPPRQDGGGTGGGRN